MATFHQMADYNTTSPNIITHKLHKISRKKCKSGAKRSQLQHSFIKHRHNVLNKMQTKMSTFTGAGRMQQRQKVRPLLDYHWWENNLLIKLLKYPISNHVSCELCHRKRKSPQCAFQASVPSIYCVFFGQQKNEIVHLPIFR